MLGIPRPLGRVARRPFDFQAKTKATQRDRYRSVSLAAVPLPAAAVSPFASPPKTVCRTAVALTAASLTCGTASAGTGRGPTARSGSKGTRLIIRVDARLNLPDGCDGSSLRGNSLNRTAASSWYTCRRARVSPIASTPGVLYITAVAWAAVRATCGTASEGATRRGPGINRLGPRQLPPRRDLRRRPACRARRRPGCRRHVERARRRRDRRGAARA